MTRTVYRLSVCIAVLTAGLSAVCGVSAADEKNAGSLTVRKVGDSGSLEIVDGERPVLRYHDGMVAEPPEVKDRIPAGAKKYAVPRCDYIHPLYGLGGEVLTEDWAPDHPHHRGIYWAWPEVDWQGKRGDLHALQLVFAKPTGKTRVESCAWFVQIVAEHDWQWEDGTPIVREQAVIRVYRRTNIGRPIDLEFRFVALDKEVQVARREQSHYGGLNIRLGPSPDQEIVTFTDPAEVPQRRAWSHRTGTMPGATAVSALTVLQALQNPAYPGDWVQYPNLSWVQPTFPASGARHAITKDRPLELRYRLWIHEGKQGPETLHALWCDYQADLDHPATDELLDGTFKKVTGYRFGQSRAALMGVEAVVASTRPENRLRCETRLLGILRDAAATDEAKEFACRQLAVVGSETCVPVVAEYLTHATLAHAARYALLPLRGEQADQALRAALGKAAGGAKVGLINLLGQRRDARAVGVLAPLVRSDDAAIARAALSALGRIGGTEAARALSEASPTTSLVGVLLDARLACAEQLVAAGKADEALTLYRREYATKDNPPHARIAALGGIATVEKDKALDEVLGCLTGTDARLAKAAAELLPRMADRRAARAFADALPKVSPDIQVAILVQLAARGDRAVTDDVVRLVRHDEPAVCLAAVAALGELGQAAQVGPLVELAGSGPVAATAQQTLARMKAEGVDAEILRQLENAADAQRLVLVRTVGQRRLTAGVPKLLSLAEKGEPAVRQEAIKTLGGLVDEAAFGSLVTLLAAAEKATQNALAEATVTACKRLGKNGDALIDALKNADAAGRAGLLAAIGPLGGERALPAVAAAAADADVTVQDAAIGALSRWPDAAAVPEVMRLVGRLSGGPRQAVGVRGCVGLLDRVALPPAEKTRHFAALLPSAARPEEKRLILAGLSRAKCLESLELVGSLLADESVRGEASAALAAIVQPGPEAPAALSEPRVVQLVMRLRASVPEAARGPIDQYLAAAPQPDTANLAFGRPVKTSVNHQGSSRPELAVDGKMAPPSFWSGENTPAWLYVDLGKAVKINQVLAVFYWDGQRYYQYTVDVSSDAKEWKTVADQSKNTTVSTAAGFRHSFDAVETRYVRVNILRNSANPGAHIVEMRVYAAP